MTAVTKRFVAKNGLDNNSNTITSVADPVNAQDVATKNFVVTTANPGAVGAGGDQVFVENGQIVTTSYSITAGKNAMSVGPITINTGVVVTVPTGSVWNIL